MVFPSQILLARSLHHSFTEVSPLEAGGCNQGVHTQRVQSANSTVVPQSAIGLMVPQLCFGYVLGALGDIFDEKCRGSGRHDSITNSGLVAMRPEYVLYIYIYIYIVLYIYCISTYKALFM